jgi:4-hydroxybenzoate polyprenyltransferase
MAYIKQLIISLRPHQWTKNLLLFAALIFGGKLQDIHLLSLSILAFFIYSFISGSIYTINDITDKDKDKQHPEKKNRPIASGKLPVKIAWPAAIILLALGLSLSFYLNKAFGYVILLYVALTISYSVKLKQIAIIEIIIVAIGFVLRAIAGAEIIEVTISDWLLVCTFFLALFLVIGKRRYELVILEESAEKHRKILEDYNPKMLDQMVAVVSSATIVSYALYTLDAETIARFQTGNLIYTIPFVTLGLFQYFYLIYKKKLGGSPEKLLIKDPIIAASAIGWILTVTLIIY